MAELTLTVGPLTSTRIADDAKAQRVLNAVCLLYPDETEGMNSQEKLDWIVQQFIPKILSNKAWQYEEQTAIREAQDGVIADPPEWE